MPLKIKTIIYCCLEKAAYLVNLTLFVMFKQSFSFYCCICFLLLFFVAIPAGKGVKCIYWFACMFLLGVFLAWGFWQRKSRTCGPYNTGIRTHSLREEEFSKAVFLCHWQPKMDKLTKLEGIAQDSCLPVFFSPFTLFYLGRFPKF